MMEGGGADLHTKVDTNVKRKTEKKSSSIYYEGIRQKEYN